MADGFQDLFRHTTCVQRCWGYLIFPMKGVDGKDVWPLIIKKVGAHNSARPCRLLARLKIRMELPQVGPRSGTTDGTIP